MSSRSSSVANSRSNTRFVRASKYRHVFGTPNKRDQCYDNLKISRNAWDTNLCAANPLFVAINLEASGGGAFAVLPHAQVGRLPENLPVVCGHTSAVLDTCFNPFNDQVIASASEDSTAMIWTIPQGGLTENLTKPALVLSGHGRKVGHVLFHPTADNVLATASADFTVKLWDIRAGKEKQTLTGHGEIIQSLTWNANGSLLVTACKDKKLRIYDPRANKVVHETNGHQGVKGSRVVWLGDLNKIATTGFSKTSDRQVFVWDTNNFSEPLVQENIDTSMLIPHFDEGNNVLFLAGKGDGNIRYYEYVDDDKGLHYLSEYKSTEPQRGIAFLPKRAVSVNDCEIDRAYKVHVSLVEPISFRVPRKADDFQSDLFPDCPGPEPALTADQYFAGKTASPKMISLEKGFVPSATREFVTSGIATIPEEPKLPQNEKEYQDAYHALRKENEDLKNQVSSREARIRQLESQLEQLMRK